MNKGKEEHSEGVTSSYSFRNVLNNRLRALLKNSNRRVDNIFKYKINPKNEETFIECSLTMPLLTSGDPGTRATKY